MKRSPVPFASLLTLTLTLAVAGCSIAGDYKGKLSESCTIMVTGKDDKATFCKSADDVNDTTFHIEKAGDKLKVVVKGCTILFTSKARGDIEADAGQTCRLTTDGYEGVTNVKGILSREGRWMNAVFSFKPTEPGVTGGLSVLFSGPMK